jgi:hypothetical protein
MLLQMSEVSRAEYSTRGRSQCGMCVVCEAARVEAEGTDRELLVVAGTVAVAGTVV